MRAATLKNKFLISLSLSLSFPLFTTRLLYFSYRRQSFQEFLGLHTYLYFTQKRPNMYVNKHDQSWIFLVDMINHMCAHISLLSISNYVLVKDLANLSVRREVTSTDYFDRPFVRTFVNTIYDFSSLSTYCSIGALFSTLFSLASSRTTRHQLAIILLSFFPYVSCYRQFTYFLRQSFKT